MNSDASRPVGLLLEHAPQPTHPGDPDGLNPPDVDPRFQDIVDNYHVPAGTVYGVYGKSRETESQIVNNQTITAVGGIAVNNADGNYVAAGRARASGIVAEGFEDNRPLAEALESDLEMRAKQSGFTDYSTTYTDAWRMVAAREAFEREMRRSLELGKDEDDRKAKAKKEKRKKSRSKLALAA